MIRCLLYALLLLALAAPVHAQSDDPALSEGEIEQLRASAYIPTDRIFTFIKLLDTRSNTIQNLYAHPRKPGREQDTHALLEQFTAIADELNDNLDDYGPHHRDIRQALPKLLEATERWSSTIKSPPEDSLYDISRKLALESIRDVREETTKLIEEQKSWFIAHPPPKENKNGTIEIPR
jgi:hypothetical protein